MSQARMPCLAKKLTAFYPFRPSNQIAWNCGKIAACSTNHMVLTPQLPPKPNPINYLMKDLVYLSRAFVEFGPFAKKEILDFQKHPLLRRLPP